MTIIAAGCSAGKSAGGTAPAGANSLETIKQNGKMVIGMMGTYPPYNFMNEQKQIDGYDADIAREVAKRLGVEAEIVTGEFSGLIEGLQRNKFDALVSQVTITEDRKKSMDFSDPYIKNAVSVVVKADNNEIKSVDDFKGKKIGVGLGTNDEKYLRDVVQPKVGEFEIVTYNDVFTSLMDLNTGRIDATINNLFALKPLADKNNMQIKTVGEPIKEDVAGIAIRKDQPELLAAINKALADMKADGTLASIHQKWFGVAPTL
ncbi:transporter substrate-binding domain-containing protein [Paenibacillus marinisediminis]